MSYENVLQRYIHATNTHQFENVKQLLHPNAVYWFSDRTCKTTHEIQSYFENSWDTIKDEVYSISDVHWLVTEENTATCIYTYHYEGLLNGKFVAGSGRATNVFVKINEAEWKIIHEHLSGL